MKFPFIILFIILSFLKVKAQQSVIATTDTHVFFVGMPNPIKVILEDVDTFHLVVEGVNCEITGKNGDYTVNVKWGPQRLCFVKAGKRNDTDIIWVSIEEFKIRPTPVPSFTVNGKDGGLITKSEMQVWNFINASFDRNFIKDGNVFSVLAYDITCYTPNKATTLHRNSCTFDEPLKNFLNSLDGGSSITFTNFKYFNNFNGDTLISNSKLTFDVWGYTLEETINNKPFLSKLNNPEIEYAGNFIYTGHKKNRLKDGVWFTYNKNSMNIKIAETVYHLDTILEERQYYSNGQLLSETKYITADTTANLSSYYMNGSLCYNGKFKVDNESRALLDYESTAIKKDLIYNDTSKADSLGLFERFTLARIPSQALFNQWVFYYSNGHIASVGNFKYDVTTASGCGIETSRTTYLNLVSRTGEWKYYLPDGKLFHTAFYDHGSTVKEIFHLKK